MGLERLALCTTGAEQLEISGFGAWTADNAARLEAAIEDAHPNEAKRLAIDMGEVVELDTYGAWILERLIRGDGRAREVSLVQLPQRFKDLVDDLRQTNRTVSPRAKRTAWPLARLADIGAGAEAAGAEGIRFVSFAGALVTLFGGALLAPRRFRFISIVHQLDRVGVRSVPIIVLITLLIGAIIAQQGFFHFRRFGADEYVVDLVGILTLRKLGVLIVSIMVAGRLGSSYTMDGFTPDIQLLLEIRSFEIVLGTSPRARIEIHAKWLAAGGKIAAQLSFAATALATAVDGPARAAALNEPFQTVARDIVAWARNTT